MGLAKSWLQKVTSCFTNFLLCMHSDQKCQVWWSNKVGTKGSVKSSSKKMPEVDSFRQTLIIRQTVLNCNHKFKQNTIMMQISRQTNRARDKILTPWWLKFDYVLPKKLRPEYQKMSKEDPYLDGNCLRIHTKSAFIEFQKSPGLTFTQVRQHHKGESSDVKELTNVTEDIYWKHLLEQTCNMYKHVSWVFKVVTRH